jgi:hypothetical protein
MAERAIYSLGNRRLFSLLIAAVMCFMLTGFLMARHGAAAHAAFELPILHKTHSQCQACPQLF